MVKYKVGIITIFKVNNYGAELQALALCKKIKELGYDVEIIDYLFGKNQKNIITRYNSKIKLSTKKRIKIFLLLIIEYFYKNRTKKIIHIKKMKFDEFHKTHNSITSNTFNSVEELNEAEFDYDIYCVGSDQVWNYNFGYSLEPFFLTFAPEEKKKISYGSSFGVTEIPNSSKDIYKYYLERFENISVRETTGKEIIESITNCNVEVVLDPTLLLNKNEWIQYEDDKLKIDQPYLLLYVVTIIPSEYSQNLAERIARKNNYQIIKLSSDFSLKNANSDVINKSDADPGEFLNLLRKSEFVITNSYHGALFSINFNKPFYVTTRKSKENNGRIINILNTFGINNRLLFEGATFPNQQNWEMNFSEINQLLVSERKKSERYLKNSLKIEEFDNEK